MSVAEKRLTGRIAAEHIKLLEVPRPPKGAVERFKALGDPTGIISDTMDELGIPSGVIGASVLRPTMPGTTMVGPALTLRNILQRIDPLKGAHDKVNKMAEFECHNLAQQGDVLVIQGVPDVSNMGGISAQTGKRQGEVGAIVQGGIRDIAHSRSVGYPLWASDITPVTGKWRLEAAEINGAIRQTLMHTKQVLLSLQKQRGPVAAELKKGFEDAWQAIEKAFAKAREKVREEKTAPPQ